MENRQKDHFDEKHKRDKGDSQCPYLVPMKCLGIEKKLVMSYRTRFIKHWPIRISFILASHSTQDKSPAVKIPSWLLCHCAVDVLAPMSSRPFGRYGHSQQIVRQHHFCLPNLSNSFQYMRIPLSKG